MLRRQKTPLTSRCINLLVATVLVFSAVISPSIAHAQSAGGETANPAPARSADQLTPEQASRALDLLQNDEKRQQTIETLKALSKVVPGDKSAAVPAPDTKTAIPLESDGLSAQILLFVSEQLGRLSGQVAGVVQYLMNAPAFYQWILQTSRDPAAYNQLFHVAWKLALVFGCALLAEWLVMRVVARPKSYLERRLIRSAPEPLNVSPAPSSPRTSRFEAQFFQRRLGLSQVWQTIVRVPAVIGYLALALLPIIGFLASESAILSTEIGDAQRTRLVILAVVNSYAFARVVMIVTRALIGPIGLISVRDETSAYIDIWMRRIVTVAVSGIAVANVLLLLGLSRSGYAALLRLTVLVVHIFFAVIILQCRHQVAQFIRGRNERTDFGGRVRNRVASWWHFGALALNFAVWGVWAFNIRDGYSLVLHYFIGTIAVIVVTRLVKSICLGLIDRGFKIDPEIVRKFPGLEFRANRYLPMLRKLVSIIIYAVAFIALLEVWGVNALLWFYGSQIGPRLLSAIVTIIVAGIVAIAIWEGSNALLDRHLDRLAREGHFARAARLRTFQPMLRTALLSLIAAIVGLTALSEVGVNVAPLLAGAGIVGIAVGFGSQKLVQDVITGLFLLLENTVQVGDFITVSGLSGTVENVSIRTIRLRAGDGSIHVIPFSAVTTITNASRGTGNAAVSVNVDYNEDTDRVSQMLKDIVVEMRQDEKYKDGILGDLELWGVDKVDGATVSIVGQIPCTSGGRWPVQREFNRRMKRAFQKAGIGIATPGQTILMQVAEPTLRTQAAQ